MLATLHFHNILACFKLSRSKMSRAYSRERERASSIVGIQSPCFFIRRRAGLACPADAGEVLLVHEILRCRELIAVLLDQSLYRKQQG